MMIHKLLYVSVLIVSIHKFEVKCTANSRVKDIIYYNVDASKGFHACFRRANGTHQFGCQSELGGNIGVVHLISKENETENVNWVLKDGPHYPYTVVLTPETFTLSLLTQFRESERVSGVILLSAGSYGDITNPPKKYSDDQRCPNRISSLYYPDETDNCVTNSSPWNVGEETGMLLENWPFPIVLLTNKDTINFLIDKCYKKFNSPADKVSWPLCAVEIDANMLQSVNSETCLRRSSYQSISGSTKLCDKLGDLNWFLFLKEPTSTENRFADNSVALITAKLDMVNLFDRYEIGSDSPTTGIVVLLAVAKLLSDVSKTAQLKDGISNVMFAFLNGESFDYIGSSNMVYNMKNGSFPQLEIVQGSEKVNGSDDGKVSDENTGKNLWPKMDLNSLRFVLELGQLNSKVSELFAHVDTKFTNNELIDDLKTAATKYDLTIKEATDKTRGLPPASLQSILKEKRNVPGIVISNFDQQYSNSFYHSPYDNFTLLENYDYNKGVNQPIVVHLAKVAEVVAEFVFTKTYKDQHEHFQINRTLINELLHCYVQSAKCKLFSLSCTKEVSQIPKVSSNPFSQYVGTDKSQTLHTAMTGRLLAYLTGETKDRKEMPTQDSCTSNFDQDIWEYYYLRNDYNGLCQLCSDTNSECNAAEVTCGVCKRSLTFSMRAVSPGFMIKDFQNSDISYGLWTESIWRGLSCRIFLIANPIREIAYLSCGVIVQISSFGLIWWIRKYSEIIFPKKI